MCELFAVNARHPQTLNAQLTTFFGDAEMHPHGWGLSVRDGRDRVRLAKGPERATQSQLLANILAGPVSTTTALAHIRYATRGRLSYDNSHPFVGVDASGTTWSFVHNGSIFHQQLIEGFDDKARGQSDSERVLLYLLDALDAAQATTFGQRFDALASALASLSFGNKLNVILDDGEQVYLHTNTEEDTLFWRVADDVVTICTRPLDKAGWQPVPKRRLIALRAGQVERVSAQQGGTYRYDEAELNAFLMRNAA